MYLSTLFEFGFVLFSLLFFLPFLEICYSLYLSFSDGISEESKGYAGVVCGSMCLYASDRVVFVDAGC